MDLKEGLPPYLHTRYLTECQQARCELNPTYVSYMKELIELRKEVHCIRGFLEAHKKSEIPEGAAKLRFQESRRSQEIEEAAQKLKDVERAFFDRDYTLASLAAALIDEPKFRLNQDEVKLIDRKWYWELPAGKLSFPRQAGTDADYSFIQDRPPTPVQKLARRMSKLIKRNNSTEGKVRKKQKSLSVAL